MSYTAMLRDTYDCRSCGARAGQPCTTKDGRPTPPHQDRWDAPHQPRRDQETTMNDAHDNEATDREMFRRHTAESRNDDERDYDEEQYNKHLLDDERDPDDEATDREMYRKIAYSGSVADAIRAIVDYNWADEERDYIENCSDEPDDNQRAGHIYESLNQVRDWLEDETDPNSDLPDGRTVTRQGHRAAALQLVSDWAGSASLTDRERDLDSLGAALVQAVLALSAPADPSPDPDSWRQRAEEAEAALTAIGSITMLTTAAAWERLTEIQRILRVAGNQQIMIKYDDRTGTDRNGIIMPGGWSVYYDGELVFSTSKWESVATGVESIMKDNQS